MFVKIWIKDWQNPLKRFSQKRSYGTRLNIVKKSPHVHDSLILHQNCKIVGLIFFLIFQLIPGAKETFWMNLLKYLCTAEWSAFSCFLLKSKKYLKLLLLIYKNLLLLHIEKYAIITRTKLQCYHYDYDKTYKLRKQR